MKGYAITIFVSVLALSSYAWDRSNTHTNYFIDTSTTISENLAPTKNIHINDQGNFVVKYPEGDTEKKHGYTDENLWKASSPIDVVVKPGVEIKAEVYSPNAGANVDATFQVGKANLTFEGNNIITASQMILSDRANVYAENTTINLTSSSDKQGLRFSTDGCKAVFKGGQLNAKSVFVQDDTGNLTFDGTNVVLESITASGNLSNSPTQFKIVLKNNASLTLTEEKRVYDYNTNSANSKFDGKIIVEDGSTIKSTNRYYKLGSIAGISVSGSGSSIEVYNVVSKNEISVDSGAKIKADKVSASDIFVGSDSSLAATTSMKVENLLSVASDSTVSAEDISFEKLIVNFAEDFVEGESASVDLNSIFGSSTTVVLAALNDGKEFSVSDSHSEWNLDSVTFGSDGNVSFVVGSQVVPEPATYAAIFGALALAFAAYRRRK